MPSYSNIFEDLSLSDLILKLHKAIAEVVETIDVLINHNKAINYEEITELRTLIKKRISSGEDIKNDEKILHLLELFSSNKSILELIGEDVDEWMNFIDLIEKNLNNKKLNLSIEEQLSLEKIKKTNFELKKIFRR